MSEPIFMTVCLIMILLAERGARRHRGPIWIVSLGALMAITGATRTIGLAFVAGVGLYLAATNSPRIWRDVCLCVLVAGGVVGLVVLLTPVETASLFPSWYTQEFMRPKQGLVPVDQPLLSRLVRAIEAYGGHHFSQILLSINERGRVAAALESFGLSWLRLWIGLLSSGLVLVGAVLWARRGLSAFYLAGLCYMGVLLVWPWREPRYLYPIQPQMHFAFLLGLEALLFILLSPLHKSRARWTRISLAASCLVLLVVSVAKDLAIDPTTLHVGDMEKRTAWLRSNAAHGTIVMSEYPPTDFLYGKQRTVPYPPTDDVQGLVAYLISRGVDYVLVAPELRWLTRHYPTYSPRTRTIVALLGELDTSVIERVYDAEEEGVEVFRFHAPSGTSPAVSAVPRQPAAPAASTPSGSAPT